MIKSLLVIECNNNEKVLPCLERRWMRKVIAPTNSINVVMAVTSALIRSFFLFISFDLSLSFCAAMLDLDGRICLYVMIKVTVFFKFLLLFH